jgi:hypothetical protein
MQKGSTMEEEIASKRPLRTNSCSGEEQAQKEVPAKKLTL